MESKEYNRNSVNPHHLGLRGLKVSHCSLSTEGFKRTQTRYNHLKQEGQLTMQITFSWFCFQLLHQTEWQTTGSLPFLNNLQENLSSNTQKFCTFPLWQREKLLLWRRSILPATITSPPSRRKSPEHQRDFIGLKINIFSTQFNLGQCEDYLPHCYANKITLSATNTPVN